MKQYAIPCIISLLVGALYNIVDQIFIANASYLGSYGNAANTVVFPLTVVALAIAVMVGDGCCAFVSMALGRSEMDKAKRSVGNAVIMILVGSLVLTVVYLISQLSFDYAWYAAIVAGAAAEIIVTFFCAAAFGTELNIIMTNVGIIIGTLLAVFLQFMKCAVDYSRKEYIQFEDDDYYYIDPMESDYTTGNTKLPIGTYLVQPDSQERVQVGNTGVLKGVYNINKGYTQFRQINILYQNEEYALVEQGTSYGLTVYDHIVLNGSAVDEDQIIY